MKEDEYAPQIDKGKTTGLTRQAYAERLVQEDEHISGSDFKKRMHAEFPNADIQPMSHYVQTKWKSKKWPIPRKPAKKRPVKSKTKKKRKPAMHPMAEQRKIANTGVGLELLTDAELAEFFRIGTHEQKSIVFNELARRSGY